MTRCAYDRRHVPAGQAAQRALHRRGPGVSADRGTVAGLRLRLRPRRQHHDDARPHTRERYPQQPGCPDCHRSGCRPAAHRRQRPGPTVHATIRTYRLISATGREMQTSRPTSPPWLDTPRGTDLTRARAYTETYRYDALGSLLPTRPRRRTRRVYPALHRRPGQQPAAAAAGRPGPLRLHLRLQRQHDVGNQLAPLRLEPRRPAGGVPHPDR